MTTVNTKPILLIKLALARTRNFYKISGRGDYREGRGRRKKKKKAEKGERTRKTEERKRSTWRCGPMEQVKVPQPYPPPKTRE